MDSTTELNELICAGEKLSYQIVIPKCNLIVIKHKLKMRLEVQINFDN